MSEIGVYRSLVDEIAKDALAEFSKGMTYNEYFKRHVQETNQVIGGDIEKAIKVAWAVAVIRSRRGGQMR